jgi:hypothetical protein
MKDVLDDHLELDENDKWKIGKIMLLTGVFLMLSMTLLSLLKEYFPEGFSGTIAFIVVILLSRDLTHRINILDKNIREYMLGVYVFVTFFLAHLVYKTFILALIIEGLGWFYNFSYCIYSALGIAGFAFVIAYFVIHKIRSKPTLLPILLMLCYILFAVILVMTRVNNY